MLPEGFISELMMSAGVPGISIFAVRDGLEEAAAIGVRNIETEEPVNVQTVFEAASLSKPIIACATLRLVDAGKLDLDQPLSRIVGPLVPDDPASAMITARHVLSHTTGLPNWGRDEFPLRTYFPPGTRFSYSGEGFAYLQSAIEKLAVEPLDTVVKRLVLDPLRMYRSSFVWRDDFEENAATGHGIDGKPVPKFKPDVANAAYSLHTTASDYGRFLDAVMTGKLLNKATNQSWMHPHAPTPKARFEALELLSPEMEEGVAWGLGWGLEPGSGAFFHWGANWGAKAFVMGIPGERKAFVAFMNSDRGLDLVPKLVEHIIPGQHPGLSWLGLAPSS